MIGFTNIGESEINHEKFFFTNDRLLKEYSDWDILLYKKFVTSTKSRYKQQGAVVVAKKKKSSFLLFQS